MNTPDRPLRVLYLVPDLGVGGAERHVTTLMPALDRTRFDPSVICIGEPGALFHTLVDAGVPAIALGRSRSQAFAALADLIREFRRIRPDVVITRGYNAEGLGRLAARITGVPATVVWVHNHGDTEPVDRVRRRIDALLDRWTSAYFGVAQAQTEYMVTDRGLPREKITTIYNGVDPAAFTPVTDRSVARSLGIDDSAPIVGIVAALRPEKDHRLFLTAAARVLRTLPHARFLIVGDGDLRGELEGCATALGISDSVVFTGSRSDIPAVMRSIDVMVLCSFAVECFPMALLEAMASGRPAVCTAVGGVPEMIADGETGFLVAPHDPDALAERLITLLADPPMRTAFGAAARRRVETDFSLARSITATETAIDALVTETATQPSAPTPTTPGPLVLTVVLDLTFVGGVEVLLLNLFRAFDPLEVRPRIVCLREEGPLAADFRAAGFEVTVHRGGRLDPRRLTGLIADLRRSHTDVVLVPHHHRAALALGRLAARIARIPSVVAAHDQDLISVGRRVLPRSTVATLGASDALVLLTASQGEYLHNAEGVGRSPASSTWEVIIPNGIDVGEMPTEDARALARAELEVTDDDFAIGIIARLSPQKTHEVMLRAMTRLMSTHPNARLFVIGDGDRRAELTTLAEDLGISAVTRFLGVRDDVRALLPGLDVACLSSVHEGVPIVTIEALAAGVPFVATDCGSLRDVVVDGETGFLVDVGDSDALADRLATLADNPELRSQLGKAGRARAEQNFQIAGTARSYERLLRELTDRKGAQR